MEEPTKFPKNAMDGLLLSLKENAESCFLDKLMEVCWFHYLLNNSVIRIKFVFEKSCNNVQIDPTPPSSEFWKVSVMGYLFRWNYVQEIKEPL